MIKSLAAVLLLSFAARAYALEYIIFKKVDESLGIQSLPYKYTVWHVDALKIISVPMELAALKIKDEEAALEFMEKASNNIDKKKLDALFWMTYAAREKMHNYELSTTPSAVLIDDDGQVVKRWDPIKIGTDLITEIK